MPLIATDTFRFSHLVKHEYEPSMAYCRAALVANEAAAKTYAVGTVLGQVTVGGKWKISVQSASDGSQNPAAVVIDNYTVPATTDTVVLALVRGPAIVSKAALVLDATWDTAPELAAMYAALEAKGILVNDAV